MAHSLTVAELATHVQGLVRGDGTLVIQAINGLERAGDGELSFYGNARYQKQLHATKASAVLVPPGTPEVAGVAFIEVTQPHLAFARVSALLHPPRAFEPGIAPGAHIHPDAIIHPSATVMAGAMLEAQSRVGARTVIYPGVYLGPGALVGDDCRLHANVSIGAGCRVGHRVVLHSSCVVGADGFGFAFDSEGPAHVKVPQVGIVRIEDDVEVGASSCIDRATFGETVIGRGTKLDNLVQIAHNVKVGPLSLICAQAGVSGSSEIGTGVVLAGQVGVVGHIRVGDLVKVGAQSGVTRSIPDGEAVSGTPAIRHTQWLRSSVAFEQLSQLQTEVRRLRKRLEELEGK